MICSEWRAGEEATRFVGDTSLPMTLRPRTVGCTGATEQSPGLQDRSKEPPAAWKEGPNCGYRITQKMLIPRFCEAAMTYRRE